MAKQEVGLKIDVDVKSVGNMKQELRAATQELIAVNEKFGSTSTQAIEAAKRVAGLRDSIGDAKALADTFNPDKKFVALGGAVQGAVAGFSALQGAIGLFGSESKEVEKLLLKVQSAMALQQGISGIAGAMDSMKLLAGTIKTQVVTAFSTLRGAIMATGIGALGIAVALVAANFEEFKKKIFSLIPGLQTAANFIGGLVTKFTDFVGITSEAERSLDKFTKANKRANEGIDAQIKILEAQGGKEDQIYNLKKQRSENELNNLRQALKTKGKLSEDELKQFRDLKTEQQVLDIEEVNRKKKLAEDTAKNQKDAADKAAQKRKADAEKAAQIAKEEAEKLAKIKADADKVLDDARRALLTDRQKEEEDSLRAFEQGKETLRKAGITNFLSLELQYQKSLQDIKIKYETEEKQRLEKEQQEKLEKDKERQNNDLARKQSEFDKIRQTTVSFNTELVKAEEELQNAKFQAASAGLNAIATLAQGNEKIANIFFAIDKALAIGKIIVDAQKEISANMSYGAAHPMNAIAPGSGVAIGAKLSLLTKIRAATSIATIAAATIAKFKNSGGAGAVSGGANAGAAGGISTGAPMTPQLSPQVMATQVNTEMVNQMGNRAARAYVLNSDIQNEQQRNAYIDRNASIGNP